MKRRILKLIQEKKIELGITQDDLHSLLGEPTAKSRRTRRFPEGALIWKYQEVEFCWSPEKTLCLVMVSEPEHHEILLK